MSDAKLAVEVFRQAAYLNRQDPLLQGSILQFPDYGQVVMTGDLHGHRRNFERLCIDRQYFRIGGSVRA